MKKIEPLQFLSRRDKWYLGGNNRLIWAPPFPLWLDEPGFWDKAHYYNVEFGPIFTWTILDESGEEIPIHLTSRDWNPSRIQSVFNAISNLKGEKLQIFEEKCCSPDDLLSSAVKIKNNSNRLRSLHLVAWTIQPNYPAKKSTWIENIRVTKSGFQLDKVIQDENKPQHRLAFALGLRGKIKSYSILLSEGNVIQPRWKFTPFREKSVGELFNNEFAIQGIDAEGLIYIALHQEVIVPAGKTGTATVLFTAGLPANANAVRLIQFHKIADQPTSSEKAWKEYFGTLPYFACSDEYLTRYYWYRWFGLRLLTIKENGAHYKYPAVCEGIGYFRAPITYSAVCHMRENRWMHNPLLAQGSLLTFIHNQRTDGGFRGYIDPDYYRQEMFYHADWGTALMELHRSHPDDAFLGEAYDGLVRYVQFFDRERDAEESSLYDIDNHYETGQEYMHRYLAVNPNADQDNWGNVFRLKGVDVTVYIYELKKALGKIAQLLGRPSNEVESWKSGAEKIREAVRDTMWDSGQEMFFDVDPATGRRTGVKAAVCFYPYMTDIVDAGHLSGLKRHLFNPSEFWTPYPVPSSSVDDEYFSSDAEWKGKRMNCPWNGRVWPMTNSHIAEALATSAIKFQDKELRVRTTEFISKFLKMMFFDGDPKRPNCFEHYNPFTGKASEYRGIDDYQHSWVNDLILKYVVGIRPDDRGIMVDPFPFGLSYFVAENVWARRRRLKVELKDTGFTVWVDKKKVAVSRIGEGVFIKG